MTTQDSIEHATSAGGEFRRRPSSNELRDAHFFRACRWPVFVVPPRFELGDSHVVETMSRRPESIAECAHPLLARSARRGGSARQRADGEVSRDLRGHRPLRIQGTSPSRASRVPPLLFLSRSATGGDELGAALRVLNLDRRDPGPIGPKSTCCATLYASPSSSRGGATNTAWRFAREMRACRSSNSVGV